MPWYTGLERWRPLHRGLAFEGVDRRRRGATVTVGAEVIRAQRVNRDQDDVRPVRAGTHSGPVRARAATQPRNDHGQRQAGFHTRGSAIDDPRPRYRILAVILIRQAYPRRRTGAAWHRAFGLRSRETARRPFVDVDRERLEGRSGPARQNDGCGSLEADVQPERRSASIAFAYAAARCTRDSAGGVGETCRKPLVEIEVRVDRCRGVDGFPASIHRNAESWRQIPDRV